jgi:hypothetical protein
MSGGSGRFALSIATKPECRKLVHSTLALSPVYWRSRFIACTNILMSGLALAFSLYQLPLASASGRKFQESGLALAK